MKLGVLVLFCTVLMVVDLLAIDRLHLKGGKTIAGQVEDITNQKVSFRLSVDLGNGKRGQVKRSYLLQQIEYISFGKTRDELFLLNKGKLADRKMLRELWNQKGPYLDQARSNTGKIGLLYAEVLLMENSVYHWKQAMDLYDLIGEKSWDEGDWREARLGRIKGLLVQGELNEASKFAKGVIAEAQDEQMLVKAHFLLGEVGFRQLKAMQKKHPRWEEDEEVRPERNQLYHETLDHYLNAYLFHGTWETPAAEGLMAAADLYRFAGDLKRRQESLEDVVQIYALTLMATQAVKELEELKMIEIKNYDEKK